MWSFIGHISAIGSWPHGSFIGWGGDNVTRPQVQKRLLVTWGGLVAVSVPGVHSMHVVIHWHHHVVCPAPAPGLPSGLQWRQGEAGQAAGMAAETAGQAAGKVQRENQPDRQLEKLLYRIWTGRLTGSWTSLAGKVFRLSLCCLTGSTCVGCWVDRHNSAGMPL
jgi:hypothetical protein